MTSALEGLVPGHLTPGFLEEYNGQRLKIVAILFIILDTICLILRFISRRIQRSPFGAHDILVVVSWVFEMALCACALLSLKYGVGYHLIRIIVDDDAWKIPYWGRTNLLADPLLYIVAVTLPKVSILLIYLRIMTGKFSRASCWILIAILLTNMVVNAITVGTQCFPVEKAWTPNISGHCHSIQANYIYSSIPNIVTDVAMMALPIPTVWALKVARSVKIGLLATFCVAGNGLVISIYRLVSFVKTPIGPDVTYNATQLNMWIIIESSTYLICACLITYGSLLSRILESRFIRSIRGRKDDDHMPNSTTSRNTYADSNHLQLIESSRSMQTQSEAASSAPPMKHTDIDRKWFDAEPALTIPSLVKCHY